MTNQEFIEFAKERVLSYTNALLQNEGKDEIGMDGVYVVWSCKTLQNSKELLSTTVSNGMYYEVTYNGDKSEVYFDAYKKLENICFQGL